jgi:diguanylate cyclase
LTLLAAVAMGVFTASRHEIGAGQAPAHQAATPELRLTAAQPDVEVWPAVTWLADPRGDLTVEDVRARRAQFAVPQVPRANFGLRAGAVWLRAPVRVADPALRDWILNLNYAVLDRADVWSSCNGDGDSAEHAELGIKVAFPSRALRAQLPAVPLHFGAGRACELLVRLQSDTEIIAPMRLQTPEKFAERRADGMLVIGLQGGIVLMLLCYSLVTLIPGRDRASPYFALQVASLFGYFFVEQGFATQLLWPDSAALGARQTELSTVCLFAALCGACKFVERVLNVGELSRACSLALRATAGLAIVCGVLEATGVLDAPHGVTILKIFGATPTVVGFVVAVIRARAGDRIALLMAFDRAVMTCGIATEIALVDGRIGAGALSMHAFQGAAWLEMFSWLLILGLRLRVVRESAESDRIERDLMRALAATDPLTGLRNRRGMKEGLRARLATADGGEMVAVYEIDLDGFKAVNDQYGHETGDALLLAVGRRLLHSTRGEDIVARLGGDEFVVVAGGLANLSQVESLGVKLLQALDSPIEISGQLLPIGLTIGCAVAPDHGCDPDVLLARADAAMYAGKRAGRNQFRLHPMVGAETAGATPRPAWRWSERLDHAAMR